MTPSSLLERPPSANDHGEGRNPYLAMREAKIARNEKHLRELGLWTPVPPKATAARKRRREISKGTRLATCAPTRRSRRLRQTRQNDNKEEDASSFRVMGRASVTPPSSLAPDSAIADTGAHISKKCARSAQPKALPAIPAKNSVRLISLDINTLLFGNGTTDGIVGKVMERTGKEHVINEAFARAASAADRQRLEHAPTLSWNKYSGVQDWNNAIFLWVNLGTGDSPNEFLEERTQMTWFGGSRMHEASPVILKLLQYGRAATKKTRDEDVHGSVILWCRRHRPELKKFTPYVCFGRLGYRSHVPESRPLSFVWDLLDYDRMKGKETFDAFTK